MKREDCRRGMKIQFGRTRGEQSLGEVVAVNPARAKVKLLEHRGANHQPGEIWRVPYSLMTPVEAPAEPALPSMALDFDDHDAVVAFMHSRGYTVAKRH